MTLHASYGDKTFENTIDKVTTTSLAVTLTANTIGVAILKKTIGSISKSYVNDSTKTNNVHS